MVHRNGFIDDRQSILGGYLILLKSALVLVGACLDAFFGDRAGMRRTLSGSYGPTGQHRL